MDVTAPRRIVVPTDFSETADEALAMAMELAKPLGSQIAVIHVSAPVVVLPPPLELVSIPNVFPDVLRRMEDALEKRAGRVRDGGIECEIALLEGNPHLEIVRYAEETRAHLIVMGTHGRSGFAHAVMGSVSERVIHRAPCPVLIVPFRKH